MSGLLLPLCCFESSIQAKSRPSSPLPLPPFSFQKSNRRRRPKMPPTQLAIFPPFSPFAFLLRLPVFAVCPQRTFPAAGPHCAAAAPLPPSRSALPEDKSPHPAIQCTHIYSPLPPPSLGLFRILSTTTTATTNDGDGTTRGRPFCPERKAFKWTAAFKNGASDGVRPPPAAADGSKFSLHFPFSFLLLSRRDVCCCCWVGKGRKDGWGGKGGTGRMTTAATLVVCWR